MSDNKETAVAVRPEAAVRTLEHETLDRLQTVKGVLAPDLTDGELQLFAMVAVRSGLDPFARQIFAVKRSGKMNIQTGIDGYRSIADRTGLYDGQDEPTFGDNCPCTAKPQPHPISSTVRVFRKDMSRSIAATAFWHEYVPDQAFMWNKMPHVMLAKVAEALALRKAFPWDPNRGTGIGADVYTVEEMAQADHPASPGPSLEARLEERAADEEGISVRDFRDAAAAAGLDPVQIVAVRDEMFPEGGNVADLSPLARKALLDRLLEAPASESIPEEDADPEPSEEAGEILEGEVREVDPEPVQEEAAFVACEDRSPFTEGEVCMMRKGHRGTHRSSESEAWARE